MPAPLGFALSSLTGLPPSELARLGADAERRGFSALALTESYNDVMPLAAAVARVTRSAQIATAIANVGFRHPALMAMGAAAVDELSEGRFVLGLGIGTQWFDRRATAELERRPLAALAEYVAVLRRLWASPAGVRVEAGAFYRLDDFRLDFEPRRSPIPIYLAAMGPGMLGLAGRVADGVFLGLAPLDRVPAMVKVVRVAAVEAGRDPRAVTIAMLVRTCIDDDPARARDGIRASLPLYVTFPGYARHLRGLGYGAMVDAVQAAYARGDHDAAAAQIPDELVDRVSVRGTPAECRAGLDRFRAAGLDLPVVSARTSGRDWSGTLERAIDAFAPHVR